MQHVLHQHLQHIIRALLSEIGKAAGWSNFPTFAKFYSKPVDVNNFGVGILNETL